MGQHNSEKDLKNYVYALRRVGCENTESAEKKRASRPSFSTGFVFLLLFTLCVATLLICL